MLAWLIIRVKALIIFVFGAVLLTNNKACREDYFFATQAKVDEIGTATPTPDGTATRTPTPSGSTATPTRTPTVTQTANGTVTSGTATATPTVTVQPTNSTALGLSLLKQLEQASQPEEEEAVDEGAPDPTVTRGGQPGSGRPGELSNWLGNMDKGTDGKPRLLYALASQSKPSGAQRQLFRVIQEIEQKTVVQGGTYSEFFMTQYRGFNPNVVVVEWAPNSAAACEMLNFGPDAAVVVLNASEEALNEKCGQVKYHSALAQVTRAGIREALHSAFSDSLKNQ